MKLDEAITIAFADGTGTSRAYAARSDRFRELSSLDPFDARISMSEFAEMTVLGERLARRAFQNLPASIRRLAAEYSDAQDDLEQQAIVGTLFEDLTTKHWKARRSDYQSDNQLEAASSLPAMTKSWLRGPVQPSCLGMAQMLCGFAEAAGARYLLVNTLMRRDEQAQLDGIHFLSEFVPMYEAYAETSFAGGMYEKLMALWNDYAEVSIANMAAKQAHHCIVMEMKSGKWVSLDPYMRSMGFYDGRFGQQLSEMYAAVMAQPLRSGVIKEPDAKNGEGPLSQLFDSCRALLQIESDAISLKALEDAVALGPQDMFKSVYTPLSNYLMYVSFRDTMAYEAVNQAADDGASDDELAAMIPQDDPNEVKIGELTSVLDTMLRLWPDDLERVRKNLLREFTRLATMSIDMFGMNGPHPLVELVHPAYHLAVATVHHVACASGGMDTDVFRYTATQFPLYDALNRKATRDDPIVREEVEEVFRKVSPRLIMPELRIKLAM